MASDQLCGSISRRFRTGPVRATAVVRCSPATGPPRPSRSDHQLRPRGLRHARRAVLHPRRLDLVVGGVVGSGSRPGTPNRRRPRRCPGRRRRRRRRRRPSRIRALPAPPLDCISATPRRARAAKVRVVASRTKVGSLTLGFKLRCTRHRPVSLSLSTRSFDLKGLAFSLTAVRHSNERVRITGRLTRPARSRARSVRPRIPAPMAGAAAAPCAGAAGRPPREDRSCDRVGVSAIVAPEARHRPGHKPRESAWPTMCCSSVGTRCTGAEQRGSRS